MFSRHGYIRHKKRIDDGVLFANLSSDFFNQFPLPIGVLAAHLHRSYTPENFGSGDWVEVFQRLSEEGYFVAADNTSIKRFQINTMLEPGQKFEKWLKLTASMQRRIQGLE